MYAKHQNFSSYRATGKGDNVQHSIYVQLFFHRQYDIKSPSCHQLETMYADMLDFMHPAIEKQKQYKGYDKSFALESLMQFSTEGGYSGIFNDSIGVYRSPRESNTYMIGHVGYTSHRKTAFVKPDDSRDDPKDNRMIQKRSSMVSPENKILYAVNQEEQKVARAELLEEFGIFNRLLMEELTKGIDGLPSPHLRMDPVIAHQAEISRWSSRGFLGARDNLQIAQAVRYDHGLFVIGGTPFHLKHTISVPVWSVGVPGLGWIDKPDKLGPESAGHIHQAIPYMLQAWPEFEKVRYKMWNPASWTQEDKARMALHMMDGLSRKDLGISR